MKPYYETPNGKLYHGDCLKIMPELEPVDMFLADPPYQIHAKSGGGLHKKRDWLKKIADKNFDTFNPAPFLWQLNNICQHGYIFSSKELLTDYILWFKTVKASWDLIIMSKNNPIPTKNNKYLSDKEYCFFIRGKDCYFNNDLGYNFYRSVKKINVTPNIYHPCQKDLGFINELLMVSTKENDLICDPYLGSGTTAIACERLNRRWIGIEISLDYCRIAKERIEREFQQKKIPGF